MTMRDMDQYLKNKGFSVKREYDSKNGAYIFTIGKDDKFLNGVFVYPGRDTWAEKTRKMQHFLDNFVYAFEERFSETKQDTTNFMNDLRSSGASAGILINGHYYPVHITEATIDHSLCEAANIKIEAQVLRECPNAKNATYGSFSNCPSRLAIEKVIFNYPATIVIWKDGTKTVVKAQNDEVFDKEKGLVMAMIKKALGNEGNYYEHIKKWLGEV